MKRVLLGITGGIAAYKSASIASALTKLGIDVVVVMTDAATRFITPLTMETLSKNRVITDMFSRDYPYEVKHISLAKSSDLVLIAPASADFIAKAATGIADDMLSTTYLAAGGIKVMCPAMNTGMYTDTATQANMATLAARGVHFIEPASGMLACGDIGKGRMAEPDEIVSAILPLLGIKPDYVGKRVLVSAGATIESIDGVRYLSNHSSGKMGIAIAVDAYERGAEVTLICGQVSVPIPEYLHTIRVVSTQDMYQAVMANKDGQDYIIKAAAPADYTPRTVYPQKVKTPSLTLELVKTPDIAEAVGRTKGDSKLIIFSAETEHLLANARGKLVKKHADMVVANDVTQEGAGFGVDTNIVTIITPHSEVSLPKAPKADIAHALLDHILAL